MQKVILSLCLCLVCMSAVSAERPRPFEVKRLQSWAPEYLTVMTVYRINDIKTHNLTDCPVKKGCIWMDVLEGADNFGPTTIIMSINGQDAKNMSEETFYAIVAQKDEHEMQVCSAEKGFGYDKPFTVRFRIKEPPAWMQACLPISQEAFLRGEDVPGLTKSMTPAQKRNKKASDNNKELGIEINTYFDKDFDWFSIQTYDFIPTADPAIDRKLQEAFASEFPRLTRDTKNPDVLIRLTKDEQQSVNSTYVPPTVQVVSNGSTTQRVYNYITKDYSYQTQQNNRIIREGGYVETTRDENLYLEIVMLDTKRIEQTIPPIVYQFKFKRHVVNRTFDLEEEYIKMISWVTDPFKINNEREWRISAYEGKFVYAKENKEKEKYDYYTNTLENWSYRYYRVSSTGLANPTSLGQNLLQEGDIIEEEWYGNYSSTNHYSASDKIVIRNGKKIKKKNQSIYQSRKGKDSDIWHCIEDVSVCVTFEIWQFSLE